LSARLPGVLLLLAGCQSTGPAGGWELVREVRFESGDALEEFEFSDPAQWSLASRTLGFAGESAYSPPQRSPHSIALLKDTLVDDFKMELEVRQTGREYAHRDLCFFFGFESPARFYYTHIAKAADQNAHNVFLVDNAPRRNLLPPSSQGVDWGTDVWHTVKIERRSGMIRVWFDDRPSALFSVSDSTIGWGRVGFGSFDDSGDVRRWSLWAPSVRKPTAAAF
jgi:hypothetical protein